MPSLQRMLAFVSQPTAARAPTDSRPGSDRSALMIDPLVAGGGKRLFRDDGALRPLRLADNQVTSTGAIIATYAAAGG
jgi:hypothetical protein